MTWGVGEGELSNLTAMAKYDSLSELSFPQTQADVLFRYVKKGNGFVFKVNHMSICIG